MRDIDTVPALLASEEHVMNRGAVDLLGGKNLAKANIVGRQIMNANPKRYNDPNGINEKVPMKLPMKYAGGTGLAGVQPKVSQNSAFQGRMKKYDEDYNNRASNPAYQNYLNKNAGGDATKADTEYSKYLKMKHFKTDGYQEGTTKPGGIPRLGKPFDQGNQVFSDKPMGNMPGLAGVIKNGNSYRQAPDFVPTDTVRTPTGIYPIRGYENGTTNEQGIQAPGFMDTIRGIINAGQEQPQALPQPPHQGYVPTIDEARKNYELQPGARPPVQTVQRFAYGGEALSPEEAQRELIAQESLRKTPFVRVNSNQQQPSFIDEATRSIGNVLGDYANRFNAPAKVNAVPQVNVQQPRSTLQAQTTPELGASNIDMNKVPSRISDAGLPYNNVGSTVNFTNADGTGQGSISERMPVNGGLAARMNDGKGSFSVIKLESPYGPGGKPQEVMPQQNYAPSQAEDYSGYISDLLTRLDMNQPDGKFDSVGTLIGKKQRNRQIQGQIDALSSIQNAGNENAIRRDQLGLNQSQFNAQQGLARDRYNREGVQQDFTNQLGLADIGIKQLTAKNEAARNDQKYLLEQAKSLPQIHQGQMLSALRAAIEQGKTDTPQFNKTMEIYRMAFGKNAMDDLGLTAQAAQ